MAEDGNDTSPDEIEAPVDVAEENEVLDDELPEQRVPGLFDETN
ncbi:hypothetical protein ACFWYW_33570 [Nonomuraea sp. NPDC059023]